MWDGSVPTWMVGRCNVIVEALHARSGHVLDHTSIGYGPGSVAARSLTRDSAS